jgi:hypothetical protein
MDLSKILSISGRSGLYQLITETKNGFIVESLSDKKRFPVFANVRVSSLEEISIYSTEEEDLSLSEIFRGIHEKTEGKPTPDVINDSEALKAFFKEAVPTYDEEQVYVSDMKKVITWYNLLLENDMLDFTGEEEEEEKEEKEQSAEEKEDTTEKEGKVDEEG